MKLTIKKILNLLQEEKEMTGREELYPGICSDKNSFACKDLQMYELYIFFHCVLFFFF